MESEETSIRAIRERTTKLLAEWGGDISVLLNELEEKRACLQEREAEAAGQSDEVEVLNRRIEAQDTLIESLNTEAEKTATLLESSIYLHVSVISDFQKSLAALKSHFAALKSRDPAAEPANAPALPELIGEELQAPEIAEAAGRDETVNMDMRGSLLEARQMAETKE